MDQGGNLYIEGVDIGKDHYTTDFFRHFGVNYLADGAEYEVNQLTGELGSMLGNIDFMYQGGNDPHYSVDQLQENGAVVLYRSEDNIARMCGYEEDNYKTVISSLVLGAYRDSDSLQMKAYILSEVINYMLGISPITSVKENIDHMLQLVADYPNPFSEMITIDYALENTSQVKISILDLSGRRICVLKDQEEIRGNHKVNWNGTDSYGNKVMNGFYFFRIEAGNTTVSKKMVFIR